MEQMRTNPSRVKKVFTKQLCLKIGRNCIDNDEERKGYQTDEKIDDSKVIDNNAIYIFQK